MSSELFISIFLRSRYDLLKTLSTSKRPARCRGHACMDVARDLACRLLWEALTV